MPKNWKDGLLSSGFPLEYEVSNLLLKSGFHIDGEQPYARRAGNSTDEFSVDLCAHRFIAKGTDGEYKGRLTILCECKYRVPGKPWLFMPDLNEPDFSPAWPEAIRCFPSFTSYSFSESLVKEFCSNFPNALKGVEVHINSSEVFDRDIRHALNQLRYAMPDVIFRELFSVLIGHLDDCKPFFILPLLVTNSPLRLLKENVILDTVRAATSLEEISEPVDVIDVHSQYAQEFRQHCRTIFSEITLETLKISRHTAIVKIAEYFKQQGCLLSPLTDIRMLESGNGTSPGCFSQFLVVTLAALPALLEKVNNALELALNESTQFVFADSQKV